MRWTIPLLVILAGCGLAVSNSVDYDHLRSAANKLEADLAVPRKQHTDYVIAAKAVDHEWREYARFVQEHARD